MPDYEYIVGDPKKIIKFKNFIQQINCGYPITYKFELKNGDPVPKFIKAVSTSNGGYFEIYTNTRKDAF